MRKLTWLAGVFVVFALLTVSVRADEESDRKELIEDIDEKVEDIGDELSGFESDSDVGDLDDAISYAREVLDLVGRLDRVKGSDSRAESIVRYYPGYVEQFREGARHLKKMKEVQRTADGVADRCTADEATLQSAIRGYVGNPDDADDAPTKLPEMGRAFGRTWSDKLEKLEDNDEVMQRAASDARFSVSDNEWSGVTSAFGKASSGMQSYWRERYRAAADGNTTCKRLALGEKHPDIEKALETLGKHTGGVKGTVTQLKKDYNEWLRDVKKLRKFSADDRDAIRDVLCNAGEYEMEAKVNEVADRWASQISSVYGTTLGVADRLKARAQAKELAKYKGPKEVLAGIEKNVASIEKLKNKELLGSNNPALRTKIEWGKKRHEELQRGCKYSELEISTSYCDNKIRPGSRCFLDCVKTSSTCQVIEFKPNSDSGKSEGAVQVEAYEKGLQKWYKENKAELFKAHPDIASCESSDKTALNTSREVITYEMCTSTVQNELGEVLDEATLELPETGE
jgi:hypothetical protein